MNNSTIQSNVLNTAVVQTNNFFPALPNLQPTCIELIHLLATIDEISIIRYQKILAMLIQRQI